MRQPILKHLVALAALAGAAACGPLAPTDGASAGGKSDLAAKVSPNTYRAEVIGLTVTAPDGWYVADSEVTKKLMDVGKEVSTSGMDARSKAAMSASLARTASIFTFFQHPPGAAVDSNAGVTALTENVAIAPGIKTGQDYFFHARQLMGQSGMPTKVAEGYKARQIGGQRFDRMDVEAETPNGAVLQRYFAARHREVVLVIIQSYKTEAELATLDKVLDSIKLDW
jgi:hypothetical protein